MREIRKIDDARGGGASAHPTALKFIDLFALAPICMWPEIRVPNRFGGIRDLAFFFAIFFVICGIRVKNRGKKQELQLQAGAGFHVFMISQSGGGSRPSHILCPLHSR